MLLFSGALSTKILLDNAQTQGHDFQVLANPVHPKELLVAMRKL